MLAILFFYFLTAGLLANFTGFTFSLDPLPGPPSRKILMSLVILVHPAITEEVIFRYLLPMVLGPYISLFFFVLAHPIYGMVSPKSRFTLFTDGSFLLQVMTLGLACESLAQESLLYAIFLHWLVASIWVLVMGGHKITECSQFLQKFLNNPTISTISAKMDTVMTPAISEAVDGRKKEF